MIKKLKLEELGRLTVDEFRSTEKIPATIILDNVRSMHNVGSAFRTADAFRIEKIFLTGITATPPNREMEKTALGATESVAWEYSDTTLKAVERLKAKGYTIVLIEQTSQSVPLQTYLFERTGKYCLVFGNEVHGVSDEVLPLADAAVEIPQEGTKHSLNISVCLGIVCWEIFKKVVLP
jgi:23S rRNA (guanosine2251-2'-O)-methyltransferase